LQSDGSIHLGVTGIEVTVSDSQDPATAFNIEPYLWEIINDAIWRARVLLEQKEECRKLISSSSVPATSLVDWFGKYAADGKFKLNLGSQSVASTKIVNDRPVATQIGQLFFDNSNHRAMGETITFPRLDLKTFQTFVILHELLHATRSLKTDGAYEERSFNTLIYKHCIR
jgi:hypothetical protein